LNAPAVLGADDLAEILLVRATAVPIVRVVVGSGDVDSRSVGLAVHRTANPRGYFY
jgi:hypothetical protein